MVDERLEQAAAQPLPVQRRMHGDAQHPGIAGRAGLPQAAMGQQGLRQQLPPRSPPPRPDGLGKVGWDPSLPRHQGHPEQALLLFQQMDIEIWALQQDAQIARAGLVMRQHQQTEYLAEQSLVPGQCLLTNLAPPGR